MKITTWRRSLASAAALTAILLSWAGPGQAATVVTDESGTNATGILGLVVGGNVYDVGFSVTTAESLYGSVPTDDFPFENGDSAMANEAILAALNSEAGVTSIGAAESSEFNIGMASNEFWFTATRGGYLAEDWEDFFGSSLNLMPDSVRTFAEFTMTGTAVPVPAAAWLFGSALCLLGWVRRRSAT